MQGKRKTVLLWTLAVLIFLAIFQLLKSPEPYRVDFAEFIADVRSGDAVAEVRIDSNEITVTRYDGWQYQTLGVVDDELTTSLSQQGVVIEWGPEPEPMKKLLIVGGPIVLILALFVYFLKKAQGGTNNVLSMRKSTARLVGEKGGVGFDDVGGCEEAKDQLRDLIDFLKHPERWTKSGVRLPRGVLLQGPPGCGKTLLARAVAGESDASFYLVSASEFVEMFVGVGAARVRDTFETAGKNAPAVVFIDELDAVGRRRGSGIGAANDEREQTLNQILVCMDGFDAPERVVVIAATNRPDVLDPALLRPGRFDRRVEIPPLGRDQRKQVLEIHTRNIALCDDVDLGLLADETANLSGADLECLVNEAGLLAVRRVRKEEEAEVRLRTQDFRDAREREARESRRFDCADALMVESTTQLAHPTGKTRVRLTLIEGTLIEGELVWADATMLKVRGDEASQSVLVAKHQVKTIESLDGTEWAGDVAPDRFSGITPDLA